MSVLTLVLSLALVCITLSIRGAKHWKKSRLPYPPGPPADPILGHLRIMPSENQGEVLHNWSKEYGDVMYLHILGKPIIVLSSERAAMDLLEKRGSNYSDRPTFPMYESIGWKDALLILRYGTRWRKARKMMQTPFERIKVGRYKATQEHQTAILLMNVLQNPSELDRHVHRLSAAIIIEIIYGHRIFKADDEYFKLTEDFVRILRVASKPSLLDISPYFAYLPAWVPGAWFIKYINETKTFLRHMIDYPVFIVERELDAGVAQPSFVSQQLEELMKQGKLGPRSRYEVAILAHQILGELEYNNVFRCVNDAKGQEEIDRVVGSDRLPDFTDRDSLPYLECVIQESMRWHPVGLLGAPHKSVSDDEYRGMFIPGGATVIANSRSITWDENNFHDPHLFKPERFLPKPVGGGEVFPQNAIYGWGRRICPGRYLADNTVWLAAARMLAVFDITKPVDVDGNMIEPELKFVTSLTSHPEPFPYSIQPRSENAAKLIVQAYDPPRPSTP